MHYLKIIIFFFGKNNPNILKQIFQETQNGIEFVVSQAVFELLIKTVICVHWSITQEPLSLLNFNDICEFLRQFASS